MRQLLCMLVLAASCERDPARKEAEQLERDLAEFRERRDSTPSGALRALASEFHPKIGHDPRGLDELYKTYFLASEHDDAMAVLWELVRSGAATVHHHMELVDYLLRERAKDPQLVSEATYRQALSWLDGVVTVQPSCLAWQRMTEWTEGRAEHISVVDRALGSSCKEEPLLAKWFDIRADSKLARDGDACDGVVNGPNARLIEPCLASNVRDWRRTVAELHTDPANAAARLHRILDEPAMTAHVLRFFASLPGVSHRDACAYKVRALTIDAAKDQSGGGGETMARASGCLFLL